MEAEKFPYGFIYITTNNINGKKYIGKKNYDKRGNWKHYLGSGICLSRAVKKYGSENFSREIIDVAYDSDELCQKEKYWINYYNAVVSDDFYNIAPGGDGGNVRLGYSTEAYLESERKRIAAVRNGHIKGEDSNSILTEKDVTSIIALMMEGEHLSTISRHYGVAPSTIADIRNHRTWKHMTDGIEFPPIKPPEGVGKKPVDVFDINGRYIRTFESARAAEAELGIGYKLISRVCRGERPYTCGYRFSFSDNYQTV